MKQYKKDSEIKYKNEIIIRKEGKQIFNPTEEMIIADGWREYIKPTKVLTLEDKHKIKIDEINNYDTSSEVNEFTINDVPVWVDKATRAGLMLRFQSEKAVGKNDTTLWYNGHKFELTIDNALQMLYLVENYASACYDNTQKHIAAINNCLTKEEIEEYNYKTGYPEKLVF